MNSKTIFEHLKENFKNTFYKENIKSENDFENWLIKNINKETLSCYLEWEGRNVQIDKNDKNEILISSNKSTYYLNILELCKYNYENYMNKFLEKNCIKGYIIISFSDSKTGYELCGFSNDDIKLLYTNLIKYPKIHTQFKSLNCQFCNYYNYYIPINLIGIYKNIQLNFVFANFINETINVQCPIIIENKTLVTSIDKDDIDIDNYKYLLFT